MSDPVDKQKLRELRLVGFDIDGVFTDGRFYLSDDGTEAKAFHTQDGFGIRLLIKNGVDVAVISGRKSNAVAIRMQELGVQHVELGCPDKVAAFRAILDKIGIPQEQSAFAGDDLPDLPLLDFAGIAFAVSNAVPEIKDACDYVTKAAGGNGAVREICDMICKQKPGRAIADA